MKSIFIGTVEISWHCLRTILRVDEVSAIITMPHDRAQKISAFKSFDDLGARFGVPVYHEAKVNEPHVIQLMRQFEPEIIYVIGWPRLVKREILDMPSRGCVGIHSSLLPKFRGGAPVNWGLIHGASQWGVTLMYLEDGPDVGDIIAQEAFSVDQEDDVKSLYEKATEASIRMLTEMVPRFASGSAPRLPQNHNEATLFFQRKPHEGVIDWGRSSQELYNWVRALTHPYPGAFTYLPDGRKMVVWRSERGCSSREGVPGTVVAHHPYLGLEVQCGSGTLILRSVQAEGDDEMPATIWHDHEGPILGSVLGLSR